MDVAVAGRHALVDIRPVGLDGVKSRFLMSTIPLQPLILQVPSWDLLIVETIFSGQFEAQEHSDLRW